METCGKSHLHLYRRNCSKSKCKHEHLGFFCFSLFFFFEKCAKTELTLQFGLCFTISTQNHTVIIESKLWRYPNFNVMVLFCSNIAVDVKLSSISCFKPKIFPNWGAGVLRENFMLFYALKMCRQASSEKCQKTL